MIRIDVFTSKSLTTQCRVISLTHIFIHYISGKAEVKGFDLKGMKVEEILNISTK